jgi:hypothetical protein
MSQTIEVESIRRMDINPGDTLVVTMPHPTHQEMDRVISLLRPSLPENVRIICVAPDVDMSVLCPSSPA